MKTMLYSLVALVVFMLVMLAVLSYLSHQQPQLGLLGTKLHPCPETPNCVCSEVKGAASTVAPLSFQGDPKQAWDKAKKVVLDMGGEIISESENYVRFGFTSRIMQFVDDVELRLEPESHIIHIRSASRVGHSDMGVNHARVTEISRNFMQD